MQKVASKKHSAGNPHRKRFSGVSRDAVALGVRQEHLSRTLHGKVCSRVLLARYRQLKGEALTAQEQKLIQRHERWTKAREEKAFQQSIAPETSK